MAAILSEKTNARRNRLIAEIQSGETETEVMLDASFPFEKERQASYFSRARNTMRSDMAHATMAHANQAEDMKILEVIRNGRKQGLGVDDVDIDA